MTVQSIQVEKKAARVLNHVLVLNPMDWQDLSIEAFEPLHQLMEKGIEIKWLWDLEAWRFEELALRLRQKGFNIQFKDAWIKPINLSWQDVFAFEQPAIAMGQAHDYFEQLKRSGSRVCLWGEQASTQECKALLNETIQAWLMPRVPRWPLKSA